MNKLVAYKDYQINCSIEGAGEVLVFLHGWLTNASLWRFQTQALKKNYRVITFDWLGFGRSTKPVDHKYTFTSKKEILDAVLTSLVAKDEPVNIIAHDIGGPPAILWVHENQERVNRLILLNTVVFPFDTPFVKFSHFFFKVPIIKEVLASRFGLKVIMQIMTRSWGRGIRGRIEEVLVAQGQAESEVTLRTILEPLEEGGKNEFSVLAAQYKQSAVDKSIIIAEHDLLLYAHIKKLSEDNPDVPAFYLKNCGHYMPIDRPEELTAVLMKILEA